MPRPVSYLVDQIFPTREVHIVAGASGVGKTTFTFQLIDDWRQGKPIMGYKSNACPFVYVSCDRSEQSVRTTLARVGVDNIPFVDGRGISHLDKQAVGTVVRKARSVNPDARLLFIEAFSLMVPQVSFIDTYRSTAQFLSDMTRTLEREDLTILGTAHSPKQRDNDQITDPRQLVLGTVAWGAFVETIIAIRRFAPKDPSDQRRQVLLLPRNAREQSFEYDLDENGRFILIEPTTATDLIDLALEGFPSDTDIATNDLLELAFKGGLTVRRTAERWISQAVDDGRLRRVSRGVYRRIVKEPPVNSG